MGRRFCYLCNGTRRTGRALPATLAWWILWRRVNYSSLCRVYPSTFWRVEEWERCGNGRLFPFATMSRIVLCCNLILLYGVVGKGFPWLLGAFEKRRSFTSIGNLQEVIKGLLTKDAPSGIYHMGDDEALSTNELIEVICSALDKKAHIWNIPRGLMNGFAKIGDVLHLPLNTQRMQKLTENYVVSNAKIKDALGMKELSVRAKDGLRETIKSFAKG